MELSLIVLCAVLALCLVVLAYILGRWAGRKGIDALAEDLRGSLTGSLNLLATQISGVSATVGGQLSAVQDALGSQSGQINERLESASSVLGRLKGELGELKGTAGELVEIGRNISRLEQILRAPKPRGGLGEFLLAGLLENSLPAANYSLQYGFRNGKRVDAVIKTAGGLVPVDSKFPLENFSRIMEAATDAERKAAEKRFFADCRRHIDDIASSYILPEEGTMNFALMYIPAENVYYEMVAGSDRSLAGYALRKRVIPVSPGTFYAYLETILLGMRGLEVERRAAEILSRLDALSRSSDALVADLETLGRHLANARAKCDEAALKAAKLRGDLGGLSGPGGPGTERR